MNSIQKTMILLLCLILLFTNNITIADTIPDNDAINYRTSEFLGMLAITGYSGKETRLAFPSELNGKKVIQIGSGNNDRAFSYNNFVEVTIPEGVESIADYTFSGCTTLRIIEIPGSVQRIAPPETLFAGVEYQFIVIKTPRGSFADTYAQSCDMAVRYSGVMQIPTPTASPAPTPSPAPAVQISVTVPVYYLDEDNRLIAEETRTLMQSGFVTPDSMLIPYGYALKDNSPLYVLISETTVSPYPIVFHLKSPQATPVPIPVTPVPTPSPTDPPVFVITTPAPTPRQSLDTLPWLTSEATIRVPGNNIYVYTGPGSGYYRARNTKGFLKGGSTVTAYGAVNGWILVRYDGGDGKDRFGYVWAGDLNVSSSNYSSLYLGSVNISISYNQERIGDGPNTSHYFSTMQKTIDRDNAIALAKFNSGGTTWVYFESTAIDEKQGYSTFRGFVRISDVFEK